MSRITLFGKWNADSLVFYLPVLSYFGKWNADSLIFYLPVARLSKYLTYGLIDTERIKKMDFSNDFWEAISKFEFVTSDDIEAVIAENKERKVPFPEAILLNSLKGVENKYKEDQENNEKRHLFPDRHLQNDFFIADVFDTPFFRDDIASMEHPIFALKAGDTRILEFEHNKLHTTVRPAQDIGRATIFDKDIWIYATSKLMQAKYENDTIGFEKNKLSRTIRFTVYDFLKTTNRNTGGSQYEQFKNGLERLSGTRVTTEIETGGSKEAGGFGLVDSWKVVEEDTKGKIVAVLITLPDWLYRSITNNQVLSISKEYFRLRKPIDRRIYELARKHCGHKNKWEISLELLHKKSGVTFSLKHFKQGIKSLAKANVLPDFKLSLDDSRGVVIFEKEYFRLKNPVDDYIYELAEKNCVNSDTIFEIPLEELYKQSGSTHTLSDFKKWLKILSKEEAIPNFDITYDVLRDMVLFLKKEQDEVE